MKYLRVSAGLIIMLALFLAGCGKSQKQQKMESALNEEVVALQKDIESSIPELEQLMLKLESAHQMTIKLEKKYGRKVENPQGEAIESARQMLDATRWQAVSEIESLVVYDKQAAHNQAIVDLNRNKGSLMGVRVSVAEAIGSANAAIASYEQMKNRLTKKSPVAKKAPVAKASRKAPSPSKGRKSGF